MEINWRDPEYNFEHKRIKQEKHKRHYINVGKLEVGNIHGVTSYQKIHYEERKENSIIFISHKPFYTFHLLEHAFSTSSQEGN